MSTKGRMTNMSSDSTSSDATWIPFIPTTQPSKSPFAWTSSDEDEKSKPGPSQPMKSPFMPSDEEEEEILDVKPLAIIYPSDEEEGQENPNSSKAPKPQKPKMKGKGKGKKK